MKLGGVHKPPPAAGRPRLRTIPGVHLLNADLHSHSVFSDGGLPPEQLAQRAADNGVELWSMTDHDELAGQARAAAAAASLNMDYVSGVEISVSFAGETVHILGFGFDPAHPAIANGLADLRQGRSLRAQEMGESLAKAGIPGAYEGAKGYAANPELISRTHFARFLVDQGHCSSVYEVFHRFLKEGKPGFVPHRWAGLGQAIGWLRDAGGVAVIAHPARYKFSPTEEFALFSEFQGHGGTGVEVTCGSHSASEVEKYADMALEFDLLASRGSDFHAPGESRVEPGTLPDLPGRVTPVWSLWRERLRPSRRDRREATSP